MLVGEKRKFLAVLVTIRTLIDGSGFPTDELASDVIEYLQHQGLSMIYLFWFPWV
jgi:hypothetical protein